MTTQIIPANFGKRVYEITTDAGKRISIRTTADGVDVAFVTFEIGDTAEYDSYNLSYTGAIKSITDKTVTISGMRTKRLRLADFAWRNYDFDAVKTAEKNAETMMYI